MAEKTSVLNKFIKERLYGLIDNVLFWGLTLLISIIIGILLRLELQVILLIIMLISQLIIFSFVFSIWRRIVGKTLIKDAIIRDEENNNLYLIDRDGLSHPIENDHTALYLKEILGYQNNDIPRAAIQTLRPFGAEVISIREWRPPQSEEDDVRYKLYRSIRLIKKYFRSIDNQETLSFVLRNDGEHTIQVISAKLRFELDAPLSMTDISRKNKPSPLGLISCTLLFDGEIETKNISPQEDSILNLMLTRKITEEDTEIITSVRLGYIDLLCKLQGIQADTHIPV